MNRTHCFRMSWVALTIVLACSGRGASAEEQQTVRQEFDKICSSFLKDYARLHPIRATQLGDHQFDAALDDMGQSGRDNQLALYRGTLERLNKLERSELTRDQQIDFAILKSRLSGSIWNLTELREWEWNPLVYTELIGDSVYGLTAREFASTEKRLTSVAARLEAFPQAFEQIRASLKPALVPALHAQTALKQNRGFLKLLDDLVKPELADLEEPLRARVESAMRIATRSVVEHETWLQETLLPKAAASTRLGVERYEAKWRHQFGETFRRQELRALAESELRRVRKEMYEISRTMLLERGKAAESLPAKPSPEQQQAAIEACLEYTYNEIPPRDGVVAAAQASVRLAEKFIRDQDLITLPEDPLEIILIPKFRRGVTVAYCDAPGPLEKGLRTFYAVAPLPDDWTDEQCTSFLREYNIRSIHNLTIHEAFPGHFTQLVIANRHGNLLRAVFQSGTFVEGWANYTEQMMIRRGFLKNDPLMKLIMYKWYLRSIANSLLDQMVHVDNCTREEAMNLMVRDAFQQESEAAGKWNRAQLTSTQLSTYFAGYQEHREMRATVEKAWGSDFQLKKYHDAVISHGSPPVRFVRAQLLSEPIPE